VRVAFSDLSDRAALAAIDEPIAEARAATRANDPVDAAAARAFARAIAAAEASDARRAPPAAKTCDVETRAASRAADSAATREAWVTSASARRFAKES
jgi:hypothetical protein